MKAALAVGAPAATVVGIGGRKRRLRNEVRENLALAEQIEKSERLREFSLVSGWLHGRIALDVARLTDQDLGSDKKPIPWSSVALAATFAAGFGFWTYWINRDHFVWYSVFPGIVAALFGISILGLFTNREKSPEEYGPLPPGAVAAPTETASERIATALAIAASGGIDGRLSPGMQADVVIRFVKLLQLGAYGAGIELADHNWLLCRLHAWLWNNREHYGPEIEDLDMLVSTMLQPSDEPHPVWQEFAASESRQFADAWSDVDFDSYGLAGNRRRVAADLDLVILAPVGPSGGYFVMTATAVPDAMTFLVRHADDGWRVANHLGVAPPQASWPPVWWTTSDPAIAALPDSTVSESDDSP